MISGNMEAFQIKNIMDNEIETRHAEGHVQVHFGKIKDAGSMQPTLNAVRLMRQHDALLALCVQLVGLMITVLLSKLSITTMQYALPIAIVFMIQSMMCFILSALMQTKPWWQAIHILFPVCVGVMLLANISSNIYLILFIISMGIFWTTYQSQVPFYPSKRSLFPLLNEVLPKNRPMRMIDIGSGLGNVSIALAKLNPNSHFEGIEIAPIPWALSVINAKLQRTNVTFTLGDYYALDFADYDIVFAYLSPAATHDLWLKAKQEMQIGSLLISHEFPIQNIMPSQAIVNPTNGEHTFLYRISY